MISDTLPLGPRRTAVAKAELEVMVAEANMNLALDDRDWPLVAYLWPLLQAARAEVDRLLQVWIMDIPGAEEFFQAKERASDAT